MTQACRLLGPYDSSINVADLVPNTQGPNAQEGARPAARPRAALTGLAAAAPGLQNQMGEYNCFLNVVVQCLWHCAAFREGFLALGAEHVQARCTCYLLPSLLPCARGVCGVSSWCHSNSLHV